MKAVKAASLTCLQKLYGPLAFALLVVLFYWKVIFGNSIFVFVDASRFFYPLWKWGSDVLKRGWIPLWNPDAQFGTPYFADPQMAYAYPPVPLLYSSLSPLNAFAALIILHHFWALLGFWVFARHQGFSGWTSFLGSLVFGFSLHLVCSSWTPVALLTISWIPWVFYAVEKIFQREKNGFLLLSLVWAMQLAAGYPVLVYLTVLAVGLEFVWRTLQQPKGRVQWFWSRVGVLTAAGVVAIAYNLVWGLPFTELFRLSNYENGASRFQDLGWLDFATLLSPFDQGHPLLPGYHGPHYWVSTYFIGLPALCLLAWGAIRQSYKKSSWPVFLLLLVLSLGVLGLDRLLRAFFPGFSLVIHSGYWLALLIFWAGWMVLESAEDLLVKKPSFENNVIWMVIVAAVFGFSLVVSLLTNAPISIVAFILSFGLCMAVPWARQIPLRWAALALALALSLGSAAASINILLDKSYYEKPPDTLALLTKPGRLFFTPPLLKEAVLLQGDSMEQAYEAAKEKLYPNWPLEYGREEAPVYNTLQLKCSFDWTFKAFRYSREHSRRVLDYLGVRYVFGKSDFKDFKQVNPMGSSVEIYENPTPLPKWYSVDSALGLPVDEFFQANAARMDYDKSCFVGTASETGSYHPRLVSIQGSCPNRLELTADGTGRAMIVSSETAYPGWKVRVNGQERHVETINHSFRGVMLNDGETRASFTFEPVTFRLGLFFVLLVCGFWVGLFLRPLVF